MHRLLHIESSSADDTWLPSDIRRRREVEILRQESDILKKRDNFLMEAAMKFAFVEHY